MMTRVRRLVRSRAVLAAALPCAGLAIVGGCLDIKPTPGDPMGGDSGVAGAAGAGPDSGLPEVDADLTGVEVDAVSAGCVDQLGAQYPDSTDLFLATQACVQYAGSAADVCASPCAATGGVPEPGEGTGFPCRSCVWDFCGPLIEACFADIGCATMAVCAEFRGVELNPCTVQCGRENAAEYPDSLDVFFSLNSCATFAVRAERVCAADCAEGVPDPVEGPSCPYPGNMNPSPACNKCVKDFCCTLLGSCMLDLGCVRIGLCASDCV